MFEALATAIDEVEIPVDGDAIAQACALHDRFAAKLADALGEFDRAALWELDGARSLTSWLGDRARMTRRDAGRTAATVRRLRDLPATAAAWLSGLISGGQVDAIVANVSTKTAAAFAAEEVELLPYLAPLSVSETMTAMQVWQQQASADDAAPTAEVERELYLSPTLGGRRILDGDLDPLGGEIIATAIRLAETRDLEGDPVRTPAHRRADALVDVAQFFLEHQTTKPGGRHRPHVNVVVDIDALADTRGGRLVDGPPIDGPSVAMLACDSALHRVLTDSTGAILDYGRSIRAIPAPLWNAVVLRDQHCRFAGCDMPSPRCDAHHVISWAEGGTTSIDNLVLECRRHHRILHTPGWHAKLLPDGTFVVTDPKGRTRTSRPPGTLL